MLRTVVIKQGRPALAGYIGRATMVLAGWHVLSVYEYSSSVPGSVERRYVTILSSSSKNARAKEGRGGHAHAGSSQGCEGACEAHQEPQGAPYTPLTRFMHRRHASAACSRRLAPGVPRDAGR